MFHFKPEDQGKMFRLGQRDANNSARKPLLVGLKDTNAKDKIWPNLKSLRESDIGYKGISVAHDFTPQ